MTREPRAMGSIALLMYGDGSYSVRVSRQSKQRGRTTLALWPFGSISEAACIHTGPLLCVKHLQSRLLMCVCYRFVPEGREVAWIADGVCDVGSSIKVQLSQLLLAP